MKKLLRKILLLTLSLVGALRLAAAEPAKMGGVDFTAEERAWMVAHPVIRVGDDTTYEPYAIKEPDGRIVGLDPDYLALIAERTGLTFRHEVRRDWVTMVEAFKAHEVDLLPSLGLDREREKFLIYTDSYAFAPNVIITRNDSPYLFTLSELKGRRISIPRGYSGLRSDLNRSAPGNIVVEYDNSLECYRAVAQGEVFASIGDVANASYLIRTHSLTSLRLGSVVTASSEIYLGVRKDWPELVQIINKVLAGVTAEDRVKITNRWVAIDYAADWRWAVAFRIAALVAVAAMAVFLFVFYHNRRLARELAERRRIQLELEQAYDRLAQISEQKSELLRTVTHDLRNPLTALTLGIDLLRLGVGADETHRNLEQMHLTAQQMMRLINDLVDAHVLESGRRHLTWTGVDAAAVFREAVEGLAATADRKAIRLNFAAQEPAMAIQSDLTALRQVADNLISNAVKFSPRGSAVEVDVRWTGAGLRVQVRDHGPGISPEARVKIFTQYGQGDAKPTGGEKSTGLGLWIVQRVVAALHGRVWSEDAAGGGALFVVELPRHPPAGADEDLRV